MKANPPGPGAYRYEAAGLRWLAAAGPDAAPVVEVVSVSDTTLELERLERGPSDLVAGRTFGARLAVTHDAGAPTFGAVPPHWTEGLWIGVEPMPAGTSPSWGAFYAEFRCLPFLRRARDRGAITAGQAAKIERVCARLAAGVFDDDAPPARIHGDLWAGNVMATPKGLTLIDPAAQGGHRITDLAMLSLFGAPNLSALVKGYERASTHLRPDWRDFVALHQLHPLLVHAAIFGESYGDEATSAAETYL